MFPPTECDSNALPRSTHSTEQAKQIWLSCLSQELECQLGKTSSYSVWKGMRVITQTDRHKNTHAHTKLQEMQLCNQRHKQTHTHTLFLYNKQTEATLSCRLSVKCVMKPLIVFLSLPFPSLYLGSIHLFPVSSKPSSFSLSLPTYFCLSTSLAFPFASFSHMVQWLESSNCHWISS